MHNLFGDTNAVHISVYADRYEIDQIIDGETVDEVLDYVQYNPKKLVRNVETWVTRAMKSGKITPEDRTMIGDPTPDVTYGLSLGVSYKNWDLSIEMMGQGGNQIYRTWDNYNFAQFNYMEQRLDRWHGEGTSNSQPLLNTKHAINRENSEYYVESGRFFRIRNLQLAYSFDKALISKIRLQALKMYFNVQNLKTWKHNTGYTPELGGSAIAFGVDNGSYPVPAIYTFGINLTF